MKLIASLVIFWSTHSMASVMWTCTNPTDDSLTYTITREVQGEYRMLVTQRELIPQSCRSRWGCDYETTILLNQKVSHTDVQGVDVFKGHNSEIIIGDGDSDTFSTTGARLKSANINW